MKLSKNFTLEEFLVSQTAERHGIDMTPPPDVVEQLERLCVEILQPLRDYVYRSIHISSGYRPPELNKKIGGSKTSAHMDGRAADLKVVRQTPFQTCTTIQQMKLPYDQLIHEFGRWVHVGIADSPRCQDLTACRIEGKVKYVIGIQTMEALV